MLSMTSVLVRVGGTARGVGVQRGLLADSELHPSRPLLSQYVCDSAGEGALFRDCYITGELQFWPHMI